MDVIRFFVRIMPWAGRSRLSQRTHFPSNVTIWSRTEALEFRRCSKEHTSRRQTLLLSLSSCGTRLSWFGILPIFLRWSDIVRMLTTSIWDISLTLWYEFGSTGVFICCFPIADGCPLPTWCSRFVSPQRNYRKQRHTVRTKVNPPPHTLLMMAAVWEILCSSLNSGKKK